MITIKEFDGSHVRIRPGDSALLWRLLEAVRRRKEHFFWAAAAEPLDLPLAERPLTLLRRVNREEERDRKGAGDARKVRFGDHPRRTRTAAK